MTNRLDSLPQERLLAIISELMDDVAELRARPLAVAALGSAATLDSGASFWGYADGRLFFRTPDGRVHQFNESTSYDAGSAIPGSTVSPPAQPSTSAYHAEFDATWMQTYQDDGSPRTDTTMGVYGYQNGYGVQKVMIGFPDVTALLSGARVMRVGLRLNNVDSWAPNGGDIYIGSHGLAATPASYSDNGTGRTVEFYGRADAHEATLDSWFATALRTGGARGIVLNPNNSPSANFYGAVAGIGQSGSPVLVLDYVK